MAGPPPYLRKYRVSVTWSRVVCFLFAVGLVVLLTGIAALPVSAPLKALIAVAAVMLAGLGPAYVIRSATITGPCCLTVQGLWRAKRFAWRDIQDIGIEAGPRVLGPRHAPRELAVVYDRQGRRRALPHLNQAALTGRGLSLRTEVAHLRDLWQQLRGEDWAPAVAAGIAGRARHATPSWTFGFLWAIAATIAAAVLAIIGVATGVAAGLSAPVSWLFAPGLILVLPVSVFLACTGGSVLARRRRRAG
jgi:hypothetical protein